MSTSCPATTSRWLNCCFILTPSLWQHHFEGVLLCTFSNDDAWILAAASSRQFGLLSQSLTPFSVSLFHISSSLFSLFILSFDFTTHCSGFLFFYMLFSILSLFILSFALWFHRPTHWQLFTQFLQHSSDHCSGFLTLLSALPCS